MVNDGLIGPGEASGFDTLWSICTANNRAIPRDCDKHYGLLWNKRQKPGGGLEPVLPLILSAWHNTMPIEKVLRFKEHLQWACDRGQADKIGAYLRGLREEEWYHYGEL
jgi:hypothetical protein